VVKGDVWTTGGVSIRGFLLLRRFLGVEKNSCTHACVGVGTGGSSFLRSVMCGRRVFLLLVLVYVYAVIVFKIKMQLLCVGEREGLKGTWGTDAWLLGMKVRAVRRICWFLLY